METYAKDHASVLASVAKEYTPFVELKEKSKHNLFQIELLLTRKHFDTDLLLLLFSLTCIHIGQTQHILWLGVN